MIGKRMLGTEETIQSSVVAGVRGGKGMSGQNTGFLGQ